MHIEAKLQLTRQPSEHGMDPLSPAALGPVQSAQRHLVTVVAQLLRLEHELHEISTSLPLAVDQCAMEDESVAMDVPLWLRLRLQQVSGQLLRRAIDELREASVRTEEDQRQAFHEAMSP